MIRTLTLTGLILATALGALSQTTATPTFEVASIKPAPPPTPGRMMISMRGGPNHPSDPGRVTWENVSLRDMVRIAYTVKDYQIAGPDWMNSARFNVDAKLPPTTSKEDFALMVQALLKDRFAMEVHRETRDLPAYSLAVAKGGSKLPVAVDDPPPTADGGASGGPSARAALGSGGRGDIRGIPPMHNGMLWMGGPGRVEAKGIPVSTFVDFLSGQLDRPVVDQTGLAGKYDWKLDFTPDETTSGMMRGMPRPTAPRPEGGDGAVPGTDPGGASLFTALQAQLGLKLEGRKLPIDVLVVDRTEKVPTEN